jgi:hypothetical protein
VLRRLPFRCNLTGHHQRGLHRGRGRALRVRRRGRLHDVRPANGGRRHHRRAHDLRGRQHQPQHVAADHAVRALRQHRRDAGRRLLPRLRRRPRAGLHCYRVASGRVDLLRSDGGRLGNAGGGHGLHVDPRRVRTRRAGRRKPGAGDATLVRAAAAELLGRHVLWHGVTRGCVEREMDGRDGSASLSLFARARCVQTRALIPPAFPLVRRPPSQACRSAPRPRTTPSTPTAKWRTR